MVRVRYLIIAFFMFGCVSLSCAAVSEGREYKNPSGPPSSEAEYVIEQNPDETYTEYQGNYKEGTWDQGYTYSKEDVEDADRVARQAAREMAYNPLDQPSTPFKGTYSATDQKAAQELLRHAQTGQPYTAEDAGLEEVQKGLVDLSRGNGFLDTLEVAARGLGVVGLVGGAFSIGVEIGHVFGGDSLDELFGLATENIFGAEVTKPVEEPNLLLRTGGTGFELERECETSGPTYWPHGGDEGKFPETGGICFEVNVEKAFESIDCKFEIVSEVPKENCAETEGSYKPGLGAVPSNCNQSNYELLFSVPYIVWEFAINEKCKGYEFFGSVYEAAMPQPGIFPDHGLQPGIVTPPEIQKPHTLPSEKEAEEKEKERELPIPPPLKKETIHEKTPLEGEELPKRTEIEVPEPEPNEVGTHYVSRLHADGFKNVELETLPQSAIDTTKGPYEVSVVYPSPKTKQYPDTKITPEQNPGNAPVPEGGGLLSPPTEPGFKLPDFGVICHGFPFGVPCWLAKTLVGMATTASAPNWTVVPEFEFKGKSVGGGKFNFEKLEPIMEILRPVMIGFSIIGIVILFYNFAKGGGPPGGSGGGGDNPSEYGEPGGPGAEEEF